MKNYIKGRTAVIYDLTESNDSSFEKCNSLVVDESCRLPRLSKDLCNRFTNLIKIEANHVGLKWIAPDFAESHTNLEWLSLCGNQLVSLPSSIGLLPRLRRLCLSDNPSLPVEIRTKSRSQPHCWDMQDFIANHYGVLEKRRKSCVAVVVVLLKRRPLIIHKDVWLLIVDIVFKSKEDPVWSPSIVAL